MEKSKKEDRRVKYTKQVIKDSFLKLLEKNTFPKITVTDVCRLADINRGTFYLHYYDMDDVLNDILDEMLQDTSSVMDHVFSKQCGASRCSYPFCEKIHSDNKYKILFLDDTISSKIIDKMEATKEDYITRLMSHSILTFEEETLSN